jgi:hypothetical protein
LVGVLAENVTDDDGGFLHYVRYFGSDEFEERVDALASCGLDLDGEFADCAYGLADKVYVYFCGVSVMMVSGVIWRVVG